MMDDSLVRVRKQSAPYALLTPVDSNPRSSLIRIWEPSDITSTNIINLQHLLSREAVVAIDFETRGTEPGKENNYVVGVGLSWSSGSLYIPITPEHSLFLSLLEQLSRLQNLVAHNVYFDGSWFWHYLGRHPKWLACTYGLYRQLATEGFPGQRWGLKGAMVDVLGWTDSNEDGIDNWLVDNGYISNLSKQKKEGYYWRQSLGKGEGRWAKPDKAEMWRCPPDILGFYGCTDADAAYQLYTQVLLPAAATFPELLDYHYDLFLRNVEILIEQKYYGMLVSLAGLQQNVDQLRSRMAELEEELRRHPVAGRAILGWEAERLAAFDKTEPARYTKEKPEPEEPPKYKKWTLGQEPPRYTRKGEQSKAWERWDEKRRNGPEISGAWLNWQRNHERWRLTRKQESVAWRNWQARREEIISGGNRKYRFNLASGAQLQWLLYDVLFDWEDGQPYVDEDSPGSIILHREDGTTIELDRTDSGGLPTGEGALMQMGEVGRILNAYNGCEKEIGYCLSYIELATPAPEYGEGYGILRPSFRTPGTLTGRLSGNDPNIQQIPKSLGTLRNFVARPGYVWVDCDHTSLENVVLAELSGDEKLMELYGPGAKPHDAYLFNAAHIYHQTGLEFFREVGERYDLSNPTEEMVSALKKECKPQRSVSKKATLSKNYGIGHQKLWRDFLLEGLPLSLREVKDLHTGLTEMYAGVQQYDRELQEQWRVSGGWILNGFGRPLGVWEKKRKDLVNRDCQSTGHDMHMLYVCIVAGLLDAAGIEWYPIIADFHDQIIIEVREDQAQLAVDILGRAAYAQLNSELRGIIPLTGEAQVVRSLAEAKLDD